MRDMKLPPPLMTSEPGSFARKTIVERALQIIDQVVEDNDYAGAVAQALHVLIQICRPP